MIKKAKYIVACNGIEVDNRGTEHYLELKHDGEKRSDCNIRVELADFVSSIYTLDDRKKDLLEIAGYVFGADRKTSRGAKDTLDMHSWSRDFEIHIKVRDLDFWDRPKVKKLLDESLSFMTGDHKYKFVFYQAETDYPTNIFDDKKFTLEPNEKLKVVLFSGGLDSLSGVIKMLEETDDDLCLVSHLSGNPSVENTQTNLYEEINELYPGRCAHYKFHCGLSRKQSVDETQRTRSFLFNSIAFALASTYGKNENILFENGITSYNFAETQDMMNSRASRTTHPKTLGLLSELFTEINEFDYKIENRYYDKTKTDVVDVLKQYDKLDLIETSVSCSQTRTHRTNSTHCGVCSQCIDRRFASYAVSVENYDRASLYEFDFVVEDLDENDTIKALSDYLRIAKKFTEKSLDGFHDEFIDELSDIEEYIDGESEGKKIKKVYDVCLRQGKQIESAIIRMILEFDKPFSHIRPRSLFSLVLGMRKEKVTEEEMDNYEKAEVEKNPWKDEEVEVEVEVEVNENWIKQTEKGEVISIPERVIHRYIKNEDKLKKFKNGELSKKVDEFIIEQKLEKYETVPSTKIALLARRLRAKGYNAKESSIGAILRRKDYSHSRE